MLLQGSAAGQGIIQRSVARYVEDKPRACINGDRRRGQHLTIAKRRHIVNHQITGTDGNRSVHTVGSAKMGAAAIDDVIAITVQCVGNVHIAQNDIGKVADRRCSECVAVRNQRRSTDNQKLARKIIR